MHDTEEGSFQSTPPTRRLEYTEFGSQGDMAARKSLPEARCCEDGVQLSYGV